MGNRLQNEQSLYLRQHAHNPVNWYPWGDEAFAEAARANKPVLVSIGYAACHWCHVMERESFEHEAVAAYMNEKFVCIKVDREEHPDVDQFYMDAVMAIEGHGGWPLNVFTTPDRLPFFGGTYFPPVSAHNRPSWMQILMAMHRAWTEQHQEVAAQATQLIEHLKQNEILASYRAGGTKANLPDAIYDSLMASADTRYGGFSNAPKFPATTAITYLLEHYAYTGKSEALAHAQLCLNAMANGGIYDHIEGGFARYATDRAWLAPHFEKMLYDNALLTITYSEAYRLTGDTHYSSIVKETIAFVNSQLSSPQGGYYCAIDADSEGIEGKYYTFNYQELQTLLPETNREAVLAYWGCHPGGNWEHTNIIHTPYAIEAIAEKYFIPIEALNQSIVAAKEILKIERKRRIAPATDDKCLLSWNTLMSSAIATAIINGIDNDYEPVLHSHIAWMSLQYTTPEGGLWHTARNGIAKIAAKLDDYAYYIQALLLAARATGRLQYIIEATHLLEIAIEKFSGEDALFFYYTANGEAEIPVRKKDLYDGAQPSANSIMTYNLWLLGLIMERHEWIERANAMLNSMESIVEKHATSFAGWGKLLQWRQNGLYTAVYAGDEAASLRQKWSSKYLPGVVHLFTEEDANKIPLLKSRKSQKNVHIFVCTQQECMPPVDSIEKIALIVENRLKNNVFST